MSVLRRRRYARRWERYILRCLALGDEYGTGVTFSRGYSWAFHDYRRVVGARRRGRANWQFARELIPRVR